MNFGANCAATLCRRDPCFLLGKYFGKIENGQKTHPVSEVTVAGNLLEIYKSLTAANDLEFNSAIVSPTLLVQGLTVAGL